MWTAKLFFSVILPQVCHCKEEIRSYMAARAESNNQWISPDFTTRCQYDTSLSTIRQFFPPGAIIKNKDDIFVSLCLKFKYISAYSTLLWPRQKLSLNQYPGLRILWYLRYVPG